MRALIAFDGSRGSYAAVDLARAIDWPDGTVLRVVEVGPRSGATLVDVTTNLARPGVTTEDAVVSGDSAGPAIVAAAETWGAPDLIIAGSRGHGPMATALIGSVAVHVAEHAPCPVLIARTAAWDRLLFAEDGSESAYAARKILATWPIFKGKRVRVVSVAHVRAPLLAGIAARVDEQGREERLEAEMEARTAYGRLAYESADELHIAGLATDSEPRFGDPAEEIIAAARRIEANAIVVGSRGRTPLGRVLLGSVARAVLLRAPCSVLVVRS